MKLHDKLKTQNTHTHKKNIHEFDLGNQDTEQSFSCLIVSMRTCFIHDTQRSFKLSDNQFQ